jgi:hypothetical protein
MPGNAVSLALAYHTSFYASPINPLPTSLLALLKWEISRFCMHRALYVDIPCSIFLHVYYLLLPFITFYLVTFYLA